MLWEQGGFLPDSGQDRKRLSPRTRPNKGQAGSAARLRGTGAPESGSPGALPPRLVLVTPGHLPRAQPQAGSGSISPAAASGVLGEGRALLETSIPCSWPLNPPPGNAAHPQVKAALQRGQEAGEERGAGFSWPLSVRVPHPRLKADSGAAGALAARPSLASRLLPHQTRPRPAGQCRHPVHCSAARG